MSSTMSLSRPFAVVGSEIDQAAVYDHEGEVAPVPNAFERLVAITQSNDRLLADLKIAERRVDQAIAYAIGAKAAPNLGLALITHARQKRARIVAQLRANRTEALRIMAGSSDQA